MKKKFLLVLLLFSISYAFAQNTPCSAVCLSETGTTSDANVSGGSWSTALCGTAPKTYNNCKWFTFTAAATTFNLSMNATNCSSVGSAIDVGIFEGNDCATLSNIACTSCQTNTSLTVAVTKCKQYWIAIGECAGSACKFTLSYPLNQVKKPSVNLPPMLICEDDSVFVKGSWLFCSDAKPGIQNITKIFDPSPQKCDTSYKYLLQCIKITPILVPQNPTFDCVNKTIVLNAAPSLFLPTSTAANPGIKSYQWNTGATTPSITVSQPGKYTVTISYTYTLNTAYGSVTKTCSKVKSVDAAGFIENTLPPFMIDISQAHTLSYPSKFTVSKAPQTTYNWTVIGGTPSSFVGDSISINWTDTIENQVCVTATNICGTSSPTCKNIDFSSISSISATGKVVVCENDTATYLLPKLTIPNTKYEWIIPTSVSVLSKTNTMLKVTWLNAGKDDVRAKIIGLPQLTVTKPLEVLINPNPKPNIKRTYNFFTTTAKGKIQWLLDGKPIIGANKPLYKANKLGSYSVKVTDINGCIGISNTLVLNKFTSDDEERFVSKNQQKNTFESEILLFPNPTNGTFTIQRHDNMQTLNLKIYNMLGVTVAQTKLLSQQDEINISTQESGIYFLKFFDEKNNSIGNTMRILKY
jgi:hypothetical protein